MNCNLVKIVNDEDIADIKVTLDAADAIRDGDMVGRIVDVSAHEAQNRESGAKFYMMDIKVKVGKNTFKKSFSVDFAKKYITQQLGARAEDLINAAVVCRQKTDSRFKEISYLAFITFDETEGGDEYTIVNYVDPDYVDPAQKARELLAKLGF